MPISKKEKCYLNLIFCVVLFNLNVHKTFSIWIIICVQYYVLNIYDIDIQCQKKWRNKH